MRRWRDDARRGFITFQLETGEVRVVRHDRARQGRVFQMHRIELPVMRVIRIEQEVDEAVSLAVFETEFVEQATLAIAAIEVEIGGDLLVVFVQDVERSIQVVYKKP